MTCIGVLLHGARVMGKVGRVGIEEGMVGGKTIGIRVIGMRMTGIWMIGMKEDQEARIETKGEKEVGETVEDQIVEMEAEQEDGEKEKREILETLEEKEKREIL